MTDTTATGVSPGETIESLRTQIDALDEKLIAIIGERTGLVKKVGALKAGDAPGKCPLRPGREAQQLRRIMERFKDGDFPAPAAAAIWRMLIMGSLSVEGEIRISAYAPEQARELFWLSREYFGPFTPMIRQANPKRVIGDVLDGKAQIGVLPMLHGGGEPSLRWWPDIAGPAADRPKIFAALPFLKSERPSREVPLALAVGRVEPEETGNDISYLALRVDEAASQHRLQTAFAQAGLEVSWLEVATLMPGERHHLVEVKGFVTEENEAYKKFASGLGAALYEGIFLGAVACPIIIEPAA